MSDPEKSSAMLLVGELMATLEIILIYAPNKEVRREASKRLEKLKQQYN